MSLAPQPDPNYCRPMGSRIAFAVVVTALCIAAVIHVLADRGLFADGAYFLFEILRRQDFWNYDPNRVIAQAFYQAPLLLGIWAGIENTSVLAKLQTIGFVAVPIAAYVFALWRVRANPVLLGAFVLIVVAVYQNINFMADAEYNFLYAIVIGALAALVRPGEMSRTDGLLVLAAALAALRSYEAVVYLGPMLVLACALRIRWGEQRALLFPAAGLLLLAAALALPAIMYPRDPTNFSGALSLAFVFGNFQLVTAGIMFGAFGLYVLFPRARYITGALFIAAIAVSAIPALWAPPWYHYYSRSAVGGALLLLCLALTVYRFSRLYERPVAGQLLLAGPVVAFFISLAPDLHNTMKWKRYLGGFEAVVNARTGLIPLSEVRIPLAQTFALDWGYSVVSLLLRNGPDRAIILTDIPPDKWQPFDPRNKVPDLHRYYWR